MAVLGPYGMKPWGRLRSAEVFTPPAVYLRTRFYVKKPVKTATLYATALGWYDTYLNGQRVNDSYFTPAGPTIANGSITEPSTLLPSSDKGKTPGALFFPTAGTVATSVGAINANITAKNHAFWDNSSSNTRTAHGKSSAPGRTGKDRPGRSSLQIS